MFDGEKIDLNGSGGGFCAYACVCVCVFDQSELLDLEGVRRGLKEMYQIEAIMSTDALRQEYAGWGQGTHRNLVLELELASVELTRRKVGLLGF